MAKSESPLRVVVCDAGPLIHLDELHALDLLADFPTVLVAPVVWDEVTRHRPSALKTRAVSLTKSAPERPAGADWIALRRSFALDRGEAESIHLVRERGADLFLTDDTAARLAATGIGIRVHGSIGILLRAIRRGQRSKAQIIDTLRTVPSTSTLHIKRSLLDEIVQEVEQSA